jgi:transposase-like protein
MSSTRRTETPAIEAWRNRPIEGEHPYVYLDGIVI